MNPFLTEEDKIRASGWQNILNTIMYNTGTIIEYYNNGTFNIVCAGIQFSIDKYQFDKQNNWIN